jgi:RNA polymerase sigma-70 factor (TIGR02957 family)
VSWAGERPVNDDPAGAGDETASGETFAEHRGLLFTVAYEMLGSTADAEDVLQDSWLRWADVDHNAVTDPRAYLVRIVTRQALNRLRSLQRRRESYVGTWLPEPLVTGRDVLEDVELADSVSFAMLVVLETLTPLERAVFVLRDVFGFEYDEIAAAVDRTPQAVRKHASRARSRVQTRRPRIGPPQETTELMTRFFEAAAGGELQPLMDLLAPDVVLLSDGGGLKKASLRPIHGPDKVARFLWSVTPRDAEIGVEWAVVNGAPAMLLSLDGELDSVVTVVVEDGRIGQIYFVRNPEKLRAVRELRVVSR